MSTVEFNAILNRLRNRQIDKEEAGRLLQALKARQNAAEPVSFKPSMSGIAVIGMSGQFPGASDIQGFWQNLIEGRDGIGELPAHYLSSKAQSNDDRWGGFMAERGCFDPLFFNISPLEAEAMHPHQRLILQEGWKALEDAGYNPRSLSDAPVGMYIGAEPIGYFHDSFTGSSEAIIASRLSYQLNLKGPALVVNTGCSSSGVALHLACESLRHGETRMALAGGVFAMLDSGMLDALSEIGMLSSSHRCRSFDAAADGTAFSEGVGVVVLKRLEDALADGDPIYATIVASGINQDGTSNGITAPNGTAQEALISEVYRRYGIDPEYIGYVEAHGTATKLGDPVEANALARAFRHFTGKHHYCAVGSSKAHIGHTSAGAGVIGLIKLVLCLKHRKIPGTLNFDALNPLIEWGDSAFYMNTETRPWQAFEGKPLMAALNSFGHSGTNAHLVVSEYRSPEIRQGSMGDFQALIPLSAKTPESLMAYVEKLVCFLTEASVELIDLAYTLQIGREAMNERLIFRVNSVSELLSRLNAFRLGQNPPVCWKGQAESKPMPADLAQALERLSGDKRLDRLAESWVQGHEPDWHALYKDLVPLRIHMPTYAFAKEYYWAADRAPGQASAAFLHPLVQQNTSDFSGQRYTSRLSGQEFFLEGHRIQGKPVLPGVAYLEMALAAVRLASGLKENKVMQLKDMVWIRPLEVEGPVDVHIGLSHRDSQIDFEIFTSPEGSKKVHGQGRVTLGLHEAPIRVDLSRLRAQIDRTHLKPEQCYAHFQKAGVLHGPDFQCIRQILTGSDQVLAKIVLPETLHASQDLFGLHPCLLDSVLQASIGLYAEALESGATNPVLPFALESLTFFAPLKSSLWCWIRHGESRSATLQKLDIDVFDEQGVLCLKLQGFSSRASSEPDRAGQQWLAPVWQSIPKHALEWEKNLSDKVLILGGTPAQKQALLRLYPKAQTLELAFDAAVPEIARMLKASGAWRHLVWIAPDSQTEASDMIAAQRHGVLQVFRLIKALLELGFGTEELTWTLITTLTQPVGTAALNPAHAGVHGLIGSLAKEYPQWRMRLFDVEAFPHWPLDELFLLKAEAQGNAWVHRGHEWFRQALLPVRSLASSEHPPYRHRGVYVVIGGAGGIGRVWSRHLIEHYRARIVWIGRRAQNQEIQSKLDELAALGEAPRYISADASDAQALNQAYRQIKQWHGTIHGVIHSAIVLKDQGLAGMDESTFKAALSAKVDACVHMAQVFGREALDFMLFFSSVVSFGKVGGQSNYAAGSNFEDAWAHKLAQDHDYAVKIMNWGYWGTVGIVATPDYQARMARAGLASIAPEEGMLALDALLTGPLRQMALLKTSKACVLDSVQSGHWQAGHSSNLPPLIHSVRDRLAESSFPVSEAILAGGPLIARIEAQLCDILYAQLQAMGLFSEPRFDLSGLKRRIAWLDLYDRWFAESLDSLVRSGHLNAHEGGFYSLKEGSKPDLEACWRLWDGDKQAWLDHPVAKPLVLLVEKLLRVLPDILMGRLAATDIMFPKASLEWVESIYKNNPIADYFNEVVGEGVLAYLNSRLEQDANARLRILEVGAGTGGTTARVLQKLGGFQSAIAEYCYTDLSQAFLSHAETHYAPDYPFLTMAIFDVEKPLEEQSLDLGGYDLVIATNVLHATQNIRNTLQNVKAALAQRGLLILNEMSCNPVSGHLTFGLLKGWWLSEDPDLRLPGSPALSADSWRAVLSGEGFEGLFFPVPHAEALGNQIIVAQSDGVMIQAQKPVLEEQVSTPSVACQALPTGLTDKGLREKATDYMKNLLGETLKIPRHRIDAKKDLANYGIDSITVIQLTHAMSKVLSDIHSTLFFEYQTLEALVGYLIETRSSELQALLGLKEQAPQPEPLPKVESGLKHAPLAKALPVSGRQSFDVAVIGLSGRYPQSPSIDLFWQNLKAGKNCIGEVPSERWDWRRYFDEQKGKPGTIYSKWGGFIEDIDCFDPLFFQISPREAEAMDPQERLFLQTAWHSLEDAGYTPENLSRDASRKIGVFVGVMNSAYNRQPAYASIANRVSYWLNFHGPSLAVDTACSSSLTALHLALESLYSGTSECALVGGVNLIVDPIQYMRLSAMTVLSPGPQCRSFGEGADGLVDGEGVGAVLLKPLAQAVSDGDHIYGVIKGSMVNAGGKTNGYTVPNPMAQAQLISEALKRSDVDARTVSYIEAHGTGTVLGDPIEVAGLSRAFGDTKQGQFCALGSVKSNIGHCESAAGMAGLTKVLLQLKHKRLVPSLHAEAPNPHIDFTATPFAVNQSLRDWQRPVVEGLEYPRRAGISSFGAGGANAHVIVEEYWPSDETRFVSKSMPALIVLSARKQDRLQEAASQLLDFIRDEAASFYLADLAYTLQVGREAMDWRLGMIVSSTDELVEGLQGFLAGDSKPGVVSGQVKSEQDTLSLFSDDEELTEAIDKWLQRGKLSKLLELWVKGLDFDWRRLHGDVRPRRISLPVYPFAKERYWLENREALSIQPTQALHPLLHENCSSFQEQRFKSVLKRDAFFLSDHRVNAQSVLPGVAYLEMARAALTHSMDMTEQEAALFGLQLRDIVWVQPLIVEQATPVTIRLQAEDDGQIAYRIESEVLHSQGYAAWVEDSEPYYLDIAHLHSSVQAFSFTAEQCYEAYGAMGIDYGPAHRSVAAIHSDGRQLLAQLVLPGCIAQTLDDYGLHPSLMDGALQAAIGFSLIKGQSTLSAVLPFALDEAIVLEACKQTMWAWIRPAEGALNSALKLDIDLCDAHGKLCVSLKGFSARPLNRHGASAAHSGSQAPAWEPIACVGRLPHSGLLPEAEGDSNYSLETELNLSAPVWNPVYPETAQNPAASARSVGFGGSLSQRSAISSLYTRIDWLDLPEDCDVERLTALLGAQESFEQIVWIAPESPVQSMTDEALIAGQNQGVIQVFRIIKSLLTSGYGVKPLSWTLLTRQTQAVRKKDAVYPLHAGVHGLIGSLAKEYPHWRLRLLDMEAGHDGPIDQLFSLPFNPRGDALAYRGKEWLAPALLNVKASAEGSDAYREGGVYVVIGGAGGIGAAWSLAMVQRYRARIVWIGRRALDAEIQAKLDALAESGPMPLYIQADATRLSDLQDAYQTIKKHHAKINGVIQSAIVLQDQGLANMDEQRFRAGLSAKVDASVRLAQVFQAEALDFVLFFSSAVSFEKTPGQSNYAAGSTFEDAYAAQLSRQWNCPVKTINWGYWGSVGIVKDEAYRQRMAKAGLASIEPEEGMHALDCLFQGSWQQLVFIKTIKSSAEHVSQ